MQIKHIQSVFKKDALELMRDRRTWFVNIVLPVLLYPVLALVGIQVFQITQPGPEDLPQIGIINAPAEFKELLEFGGEQEDREVEDNKGRKTIIKPSPVLRIKELTPSEASAFQRYLDSEEKSNEESLLALQKIDCSSAIVCHQDADMLNNWRLELVANNAHPDYLLALRYIRQAAVDYQKILLKQRLADSGLSADFTKPAALITNNLASTSESVTTHFLAAFLPVILVLMVIVGTFHPAPDLIAGERERGTLETLLSWPSDRQSIFIGKLLVVIVATIVTVLLNLGSLSITAGIISNQLPSGGNNRMMALSELVNIGPRAIVFSIIALFPITLLIATLSLAVAGLAKSYKEAQNYLSPMVILFTMPSMIVLLPHIKPNMLLDLIPLIGPLVALKACLQGADMAVMHLFISTAASFGIAAMVVSWATTLLNKEQFLFPNIKNISLKQFKQMRQHSPLHGGLEAKLMFAAVLGTFLISSAIFANVNTVVMVSAPLIVGIAIPCLLFVKIGGYDPRQALYFNKPNPMNWAYTILLIPLLILVSGTLGNLQAPYMPENLPEEEMMRNLFNDLTSLGGIPLLVVCVAVVPGICEELLCRGVLLSGFNKSLGPRYAILMSAFLFAAMHMSPYRFVPQFVLGIFLAVVVLRTRSIWPAMVLHFAHNGLLVLGATYVESDPDLQRKLQEAAGGDTVSSTLIYGSIIAFVICASMAAAICHLLKPPPIEAGSEANPA